MPELFEVHNAIRFIYQDKSVPVKQMVSSDNKNPNLVRPIFGAIGFDFIRIIVFELDDGHQLKHLVADPETYFWGSEIFIDEINDADLLNAVEELTDADRFLLTGMGALIPLGDNEIVLPYPEIQELPANMRLES